MPGRARRAVACGLLFHATGLFERRLMQDSDYSSSDALASSWEPSACEASSADVPSSWSDETPAAASALGSPRWQLSELMPLLKARAFKLCRDAHESEDLVQETLLRALRFESNFVAGTNLRAWLCTVLGNVFISRCRSRQREHRALADWSEQAPLHAPGPASPERACMGPGVERALSGLPASFAQVVRLVDLEDHAYNDVARSLGIPVGTVMSRLFRARRLLAIQLAESA
jgi:RNA polymerase sigma-70 factor, ECF subfamily